MPTIEAFIVEGSTSRQKQDLIATMTAAVVNAIDAPIESVRVIVSEVAAHNFGVAGRVALAPGALLQVFLIAGRSDQQKVRLIAGLTEAAVGALAVDRSEVRIFIKDIPNTDFGLGGQTAESLGRGIGRAAMMR